MRRLLVLLPFALVPFAAIEACSTKVSEVGIDDAGETPEDGVADVTPPPKVDGGEDGGASNADGGCPTTKTVAPTGETCTGFGATKDPCDPACGLPAYGYLCVNGSPPGFTGCVQARATSFGDTYCCPKNDCVAEPDQDTQCSGVAGKPHLFQCPPDGTGGGSVAPPANCAPKTVAGSPYAYYCCP